MGLAVVWLVTSVSAQTQPSVEMGSTQGHTYNNDSLNLTWEFPSDWAVDSDAVKALDVESQALLRLLPSGPQSSEYFQLGFSDQSQYETIMVGRLAEKGWAFMQSQSFHTLGGGVPAHRYNFQSKTTPTQYLSVLFGPRLGHVLVLAVTAASTSRTDELIKSALSMKIRPDWSKAKTDAISLEPPPVRVMISSKVSQERCFCGIGTHPYYPEEAKKAHIQGSVIMLGHIDKKGEIKDLYVEEGNPILSAAAIEAVSRWKYKPYQVDGRPVEVETQISVNFTLQQ